MLRKTGMLAVMAIALGASMAEAGSNQVPGGRPPRAQGRAGQGSGTGLIRKLDTDGDGELSKPELAPLARRLAQRGRGKGQRGATGGRGFDKLDTDHNGKLSASELKRLQQARGQQRGVR